MCEDLLRLGQKAFDAAKLLRFGNRHTLYRGEGFRTQTSSWKKFFHEQYRGRVGCQTRFLPARAYRDIPHYSGLDIDRASVIRWEIPAKKDGDALNVLTESASAQLVLFYSYSGLLSKQTPASKPVLHKYKLVTLPATSVPENCIDQRIGRIFLGLDAKQQAVFAVSVENQAADAVAALKEQAEWVELRREGGPNLPPAEAALVAYAAGLVYWARRNLYSSVSGNKLLPLQGGHARAAEGERPVFTRIDPAVIMAVTFGDWILLGRQSEWSKGRFSLLAGFCEVGETLEQAVVRETQEEAKVHVDLASVRYHSSQPWPFPQSLMIGFTAEASREQHLGPPLQEAAMEVAKKRGITAAEVREIIEGTPQQPNPADQELEAAFWFHRTFVADSLKGLLPVGIDFAIPGPHALANRMIAAWAAFPSSSDAAQRSGQSVPDVVIDVGRFKYILLRISSQDPDHSKLIVRGDRGKEYHADILEAVRENLHGNGLQIQVLGGGRIENSIQDISVFGYSSAFGAAPHEVTAALLRREYPMANISASYSGY